MRATADHEPAKRLMLRSFCVVSGALAVAIAAIGFAPGHALYRGDALAAVAPVASAPVGLASTALVLAALGVNVWRRPLLANALLWSVISICLAVFMLAFTAAPYFPRDGWPVDLPATELENQLMLALMILQLVLLPVACGMFALATRAPRPERIARARVHRIGHVGR
jgi:hypothetical protein